MSSTIVITGNEIKLQLRRKAIYICFIILTILISADIFPPMYPNGGAKILTSLDFSLYRRLCLRVSGDINLFYYLIIVILVPGRILDDKKNECLDILMGLPISKKQYIFGKILGNIILFSVMSLLTMLAALILNAFYNPVKIEVIYILFFYLFYIELMVSFSIILSSVITYLTKKSKLSTFLCLVYLAFSVLSSTGSVLANFTIVNGNYESLLRAFDQFNNGILFRGLLNLIFSLAIIAASLLLLNFRSRKYGDREI